MKPTKRIISLCLILCLALTVLALFGCQANEESYPRGKNIIYIIGDGMGKNHIENTKLYMGVDKLGFESGYVGDVTTHSASDKITDSAASATALATGVKTNNKHVGIDPSGNRLKNIMESSHERGRRTAIVTSDYLSGATPAAFSSHAEDRKDIYDIMDCQADGTMDLLIGKHDSTYMSTKRIFTDKGYVYTEDLAGIRALSRDSKIVGNILNFGSPYDPSIKNAVSLKSLVEYALDYLTSSDDTPFTLMVEGAYIDKHSHDNDIMPMIYAMMDLNDTLDYVIDWAGKRDDTVIIFTADHETGGLGIADSKDTLFDSLYTSDDHTSANVPLYVFNFDTDKTSFDNTDVYKIAEAALNYEKKEE